MNFYTGIKDLPGFKHPSITIGSFDGVHQGHQQIIQQLNDSVSEQDSDSIIITFEPHPRQVIYPKDQTLRLITDLEEKKFLMEFYKVRNLVVVPFTVEFSQIGADEYIQKFLIDTFQPSTIIIGYDHKFGLNRQGDINYLRWYESKYGYKVTEISQHLVSEIAVSSSKIRTAIEQGQLETAKALLGHPFIIGGTVVKGNQLGTKIGFPTANLQPLNSIKLVPPDGIYAVFVHIKKEIHKGVLYIGHKPTVGSHQKSIEVHIFDYKNQIYEEYLLLELVEFIRADMKFDNIETMTKQISLDAQAARNVLTETVKESHFKT